MIQNFTYKWNRDDQNDCIDFARSLPRVLPGINYVGYQPAEHKIASAIVFSAAFYSQVEDKTNEAGNNIVKTYVDFLKVFRLARF